MKRCSNHSLGQREWPRESMRGTQSCNNEPNEALIKGVLYQGTASTVPQMAKNPLGFSHCGFFNGSIRVSLRRPQQDPTREFA